MESTPPLDPAEHAGSPAPLPKALGHYAIEGELGRGGMGVVYLAHDVKLERQVAIKTLPADLARDPDQLARFEREAKLLASLNHPNIATIHGLEMSDDGTRYLILERVEGVTLSQRLQSGPLPLDEAMQVCGQIAEALEAAHERGVIHRDLKPRNVMLTPGGRVKVLDFGIAKRSARDVARDAAGPGSMRTEIGVILGTPGYMSPEQVLAQPQDARTDLFAFGCVLYECLTGQKAFEADSVTGLVAAVLHGQPDGDLLPKDTPIGVREVLNACLEKDPDRRPEGATRVRKALRRELRDYQTGMSRTAVMHSATPHNLPKTLASFVGRGKELAECAKLLEHTRLLTLIGAGGSGKTRLAVKIAEGNLTLHPGGVWLVDLAPLNDPGRVATMLATVLGVRDEPGQPLERTLAEHLRDKNTLLVFDNCEHVLGTCAELISGLLESCDRLQVIATSREALAIGGEQVYAVPTLSVPDERVRTAAAAESFEAVKLFVARATQVQPTFALTDANAATVGEICRRLDGIPLAIELAAARVKMLTVEQIRAKLDDRFRLLTGGSKTALARHQTLRATIQWSFDQLHGDESRLLRALAVFAGGWTLEAATSLCGISDDEFEVLDLLTRLVDKSLVLVDRRQAHEMRYRMLETVRQFALERLHEAGEGQAVRDRHFAHFLALAQQAESQLTGPEQASALARLGAEHENLAAALEWNLLAPHDLRLVSAIWRYWVIRGHLAIGRRLLERALSNPGEGDSPERAKALYGLAAIAYSQSDFGAARERFEQSLAAYRELGDRERVAAALSGLGNVCCDEADYPPARSYYEQALTISREIGNKRGMANNLNNLGVAALRQGDLTSAHDYFEEAQAFLREVSDMSGLASALGNLAMLSHDLGDPVATRKYLIEGLELMHELGTRRPHSLEVAAALAANLGDSSRAASLVGAAAALREEIGMPPEDSQQGVLESVATRAKTELGEEAFASAWQSGYEMPFEKAVDGALEWLDGVKV